MSVFENINIGILIRHRIVESGIQMGRICSFFKTTEVEIENMCNSKNLDSDLMLKWSKLLEYDFFRIYSQHLILYSPSSALERSKRKKDSKLPVFRKNIYTKGVIDFMIELIDSGEKTKVQVIEEYNIPKTTLYKWICKYKK